MLDDFACELGNVHELGVVDLSVKIMGDRLGGADAVQ